MLRHTITHIYYHSFAHGIVLKTEVKPKRATVLPAGWAESVTVADAGPVNISA
jgi:hypothetical protein